jgi:hypothetical protein
VHLRKRADEGMRVSAEVGLRWEKMEGTGQLPQRRRLGREWREGWEGLRTEKPDCLKASRDLGPRGGLDVTAIRVAAPPPCAAHLTSFSQLTTGSRDRRLELPAAAAPQPGSRPFGLPATDISKRRGLA